MQWKLLLVLAIVLCGIFVTFWAISGAKYADTAKQLEYARRTIDGAGRRSADLERRLGEATDLARSSADRVGQAASDAGRIADRGKRIVALVDAIRAVVISLRAIAGEPVPVASP